MHISDYISPALVIFPEADDRNTALKQLVHIIFKSGKIQDEQQFLQAILNREQIVSTGIGMGVAIPHAKLHSFDHFFIAIGILKKPVYWQALDDSPVRIIFMIGGPDDKQTEYLQILSHLTHAIKDEDLRKKLLNLGEATDIIELFQSI